MRDEDLNDRLRYGALRCAVERYCPLGFHATWAYATTLARPLHDLRRDAPAMARALNVLEESRSVWLDEVDVFAAIRRTEKAAGRRSPRAADLDFFAVPRWPGRDAPSRLGLVAAVADRHRYFRTLPPPNAGLAGPGRSDAASSPPALHMPPLAAGLPLPDAGVVPGEWLERCVTLRGVLDALAVEYLARVGASDSLAERVGAVRGDLRELVRNGHRPVNVPVYPWVRFADLLAYAVGAL
ncbi:hypothetical protein J4573_30245 [Actinomadura barringtoniae]|uniref:Uncharacterized protein n=1 Tax=Actinomadura barringtoniae TaxID=1427535 RepID=A0A939TCM3_9ACTN|nr:hypothetical protein [Actinomadura barringtoniae]MBO2451405.1 hypothetical protein [Actinomadura barringtoniae]